jgi:formate dehydrogenase major subunit
VFPRNLEHSDCFVIMGSNMAECHPVAFRWPMKAKMNGAKLIHVDPRFTRTSANCDIHAPIRAGSDIAFLGGLINHVINSERWNTDSFFREYVVNYTNAATIVSDDFKDTEDLEGVFSGLVQYTEKPEWPYNAFVGQYQATSWQYKATAVQTVGEQVAYSARAGEAKQVQGPQAAQPAGGGQAPPPPAPTSWDDVVRSLKRPAAPRDVTLQNPRCVFQVVKRHYARYTPEVVEQITGCPQAKFLQVAETLLQNSGRDRTSAFAYAVAWTQHTYGVQMISCCALLQLLLGNMGRPGGGIMALRGHAAIQGSTDVPTLYHSIHGYMSHPTVLKKHETLRDYITTETPSGSYWANLPKFMVSYLKSFYGAAATRENNWGYDWHPKILGDHSHIATMAAMEEDRIKGMLCVGQTPATSLNGSAQRAAMRKLEWLVVKDNWLTETATQWYSAPEIKNGDVKVEDINTEIFFFPSTQIAEYDGSFTNTQRMLQWHFKAADAPGDCKTDTWFYYHLGKRMKQAYANSSAARDQGWKNTVWDYDRQPGTTAGEISDEPDELKILKEINGFQTADPGKHLAGFGELKDDGSTTCASWIYCGCYPAADRNLTARRTPDPPGAPGAHLNWGWAWPANRRIMYNRASADPQGRPWSERKRWIWWDGAAANAPNPLTGAATPPGKWIGYDVPDFALTKAPNAQPRPDGIGLDAMSGIDAFIMKPDGKGWLYVPSGLVDGPLPTHYEPVESPVQNLLYPKQQTSPVYKHWAKGKSYNQVARVGDPDFPHVITTYRLTEHYLAGAMSRWLPWLAELQPELFIEMGRALADEKGIRNLDWVKIRTPRSEIRAKALVTDRIGVMNIAGKRVHHVGMPWHWGWEGLSTGDVVNDLTSWVGDPNVAIHEGKAFLCNVEKD